MQGNDLITGVKLLNALGVSGSDPTIQILLKVLTKQANTLDLGEIIYLHFLLGRRVANIFNVCHLDRRKCSIG